MSFNIRGAVLHNIQKLSNQELTDLVEDSIRQREEKYLPGLGVIFEAIWTESDPNLQQEMISVLHQRLTQNPVPAPNLK
jgi:small acid-soluble spore protein I (minor)